MSSFASIGFTVTQLRGLGLGSEVDDDELRRGDAVLLVPEPSNPRDPNAVKAVTPNGLLIGRIHQRHADAGFSEMLGTIARKSISHQASIHSVRSMDSTWGGNRRESTMVRIELSSFGSPSKTSFLQRLMSRHKLPFREAPVDASTPTPAAAEAARAVSVLSTMPSACSDPSPVARPFASSSTSRSSGRVSLASAGRGGDVRGAESIKEGEVVDLTMDSDAKEGVSTSMDLSVLLAGLRGMVVDKVGRFLTAAQSGVHAGDGKDRELWHHTLEEAGMKDFPFLTNVCWGNWEGGEGGKGQN